MAYCVGGSIGRVPFWQTGFLDSEPAFALVCLAQRPGPVAIAAVFPEFIARDPTGPAQDWPSRKEATGGAARKRKRGHGPARLDGQAPLATVADKAMDLGTTDAW